MTIAILGCGPAGLLAAHACAQCDVPFVIYSSKTPSNISGAQFLHQHIPDLTDDLPDGVLEFKKWGNAQHYAMKVYGDPVAPTSWDSYHAGPQAAWSMQNAYKRLWSAYNERIHNVILNNALVKAIKQKHEIVMSTVPLKHIAGPGHWVWKEQRVWITQGAQCPDMTIVYNGDPFGDIHDWYRESNVFGHASREWSFPPNMPALELTKPLGTNYVPPEWLHTMGRYGTWTKGELIHDAYNKAIGVINEVL